MLDSSRLVLEIDAAASARQAKLLPLPVWRVLRLFDAGLAPVSPQA